MNVTSRLAYLRTLPTTIPPDRVLVHNVRPPRIYMRRPTTPLGRAGFRAWVIASADPGRVESCSCGWAPKLGPHYRTLFSALF